MELTAYPKININLHVGKKRPDGYHSLSSVFQLVRDSEINDRIFMEIEESSNTHISILGIGNVADCIDNTMYKAVELYLLSCKLTASVKIRIEKGIPSPAGLGGGSSDAGTVLLALNSHFRCLNRNQLIEFASKIGSDVPFFVCGSDTAVVEGRGEIVTPMETRKDIVFRLFPGQSRKKGTAQAYELLDSRESIGQLPSKEELIANYNGPFENIDFTNDFEILYPQETKGHLSGSGTYRFLAEHR